jgi:alkylation response protein AidB-like acyl-CoA dehydrogenase
MSSSLTEEQQELVSFLRSLLAQRSDSAAVRSAMASADGWDRALWRVLCEEIGAASLAIPEKFGGAGFTAVETHLVLEELGYALTPSPFLASVGIAAPALLATDASEACERVLPGVADGSSIATLAWADASGNYSPETVAIAARRESGWLLDGEAPLVLDGLAADGVLAIARTPEGPALFLVDAAASVDRVATPAVDPTLRFATLRFDAAPAELLSADSAVFEAIRTAALSAIAALQTGAAARGLDMTVTYAGQRRQFGRLIGSFQALKHRMADMHVRVETSRTASRAAARAIAEGAPTVAEAAMLAKSWCGESLDLVASETIQLHGGIGITWEHDAHLIFKRAHALRQLFGTPEKQRERLAVDLGLVAGEG